MANTMANTEFLADATYQRQNKGQESTLVVEVELGQTNMPKPLLSGYFNSNLNSVENINEVARSLDSQEGLKRIKQSLDEDNSQFLKSNMQST